MRRQTLGGGKLIGHSLLGWQLTRRHRASESSYRSSRTCLFRGVFEDVAVRYRLQLSVAGHKVHDVFCRLAYVFFESIQSIVVGTLIGLQPDEVRCTRY